MDTLREIPKSIPCPCGSGKKFGECCKKKSFRFGIKDCNLVKTIPINDIVFKALEENEERFFEYYGRKFGENDFVAWDAPIYNDDILLQMVYILRELGIPENKIYAYYKSDGLLPCDENINLLSQNDIEEFD